MAGDGAEFWFELSSRVATPGEVAEQRQASGSPLPSPPTTLETAPRTTSWTQIRGAVVIGPPVSPVRSELDLPDSSTGSHDVRPMATLTPDWAPTDTPFSTSSDKPLLQHQATNASGQSGRSTASSVALDLTGLAEPLAVLVVDGPSLGLRRR